MMRRLPFPIVLLTLFPALGAGCGAAPRPPASRASSSSMAASPVTLAIDGASNEEPAVAIDGSRVVVAWIATAGDESTLYAATSADAGSTFSAPVRVNDQRGDVRAGGDQAPRLAFVDHTLAVAWSSKLGGTSRVRIAESRDDGKTFTPARTAHDETLTGARGWASLAGGAALQVSWLDGRDAMSSSAPPMNPGEHHMRQDLYHAVLAPDGARVETRIATDVCFCCKTATAIAPNGDVYVAWRHVYPTNMRDIAVARSIDGGRTFSAPVRVNEDGWQLTGCPEDGPSIAVDAAGTLHVLWPSIATGGGNRKAVYYAVSRDRGRTFSGRRRVDTAQGTGSAAHAQLAARDGVVWGAWEQSGGDVRAVWTAALSDAGGDVAPARRVSDPNEAGYYPSVAVGPSGPVLAWVSRTGTASVIRVARLVN